MFYRHTPMLHEVSEGRVQVEAMLCERRFTTCCIGSEGVCRASVAKVPAGAHSTG